MKEIMRAWQAALRYHLAMASFPDNPPFTFVGNFTVRMRKGPDILIPFYEGTICIKGTTLEIDRISMTFDVPLAMQMQMAGRHLGELIELPQTGITSIDDALDRSFIKDVQMLEESRFIIKGPWIEWNDAWIRG